MQRYTNLGKININDLIRLFSKEFLTACSVIKPVDVMIKNKNMKIRIILSLMALSTLIYSCKKDNSTTPDSASGFYVQALKNNSDWSGTPKAIHWSADSVAVQGSGPLDLLNMKFKFNGIGQYTLVSDPQDYYWLFGEVIIKARYALRTDVPSTVNVTNYNPDTKIIEGTFNLYMVKTAGTVTTDPQNIDFLNGRFRAQLLN